MAYGDKTTHGAYEYWEGAGGTFFRRSAGSKEDYYRVNIGEVPDAVRREAGKSRQ